MNLKTYLETTTQKELAELLGVTQGLVSQWVTERTQITAERCIQIETKTHGVITRHELRPDIFPEPSKSEMADAAA